MSLLINRVEVSYFGGINGTIELDLSAPLTLIFAPNGSGKTSIIEGLNWAFCSTDVREPRCRLAEASAATSVDLTIQRQNRTESFIRRTECDHSESRLVDNTSCEPVEYLRKLAPDCNVGHLHHLSQKKRLVEHLSRNRVLMAHTLTHLIDETEAGGRSEAMAELLGTRAQENALTQIELYDRRLEKRLSELRSAAAQRTARKEAIAATSTVTSIDLDRLTADVCALLGVPPDEVPGDRQLALEANYSDRTSRLDIRISASEALAHIQDRRLPQDTLPPLEQEEAAVVQAANAIASTIASQTSESRDSRARLGVLSKELDLLTSLGSAVREVAAIVGEREPNATWASTLNIGKRISETFGSAAEARQRLRNLQEKLPNWRGIIQQLTSTE